MQRPESDTSISSIKFDEMQLDALVESGEVLLGSKKEMKKAELPTQIVEQNEKNCIVVRRLSSVGTTAHFEERIAP